MITQVEKVMIAVAMMIMFISTASMAVEVGQVHIMRFGPQTIQAIEIDGVMTQMNADGNTWINMPVGQHVIKDQQQNGGIETTIVNVIKDHVTTVVMRGQVAVTVEKKANASSISAIQQPVPTPTVQQPPVVETPQPTPTVTVQPTPEPTKKPKEPKEPHDNRDGGKKPKNK